MARPRNTDPFQNFRFHLIEAGSAEDPILNRAAGFMTLSIPELTVEMGEYKTGIMKFKQKYPGPPTVSDVSFTQGVFRSRSPLYAWVRRIIDGGQEYRKDLLIYHYHIQDKFDISQQPSRVIRLRECWPTTFKPAEDLDPNSADVSFASLTLAVEQFEIDEQNLPAGLPNLAGTP